MKPPLIAVIAGLLLVSATASLAGRAHASGDHAAPEADVSERVGPGRAVIAYDKEEGFKLSEKAMQNLKVTFKKVDGNGPWTLPADALVTIKQSTGVYRRFEGWITFVLVTVTAKNGTTMTIKSEDLQASDEVAVSGASFLRMTEADLNSGTVDSCAH